MTCLTCLPPVINQMDTSGKTLGPRSASAPKPENFSKDELSAILKFGAQNMFKSDANEQNKKLDEMDLDDILNRAEDHETEGIDAGGASLGGEAFLNSFAAVQDISAADLSWDDIIPQETREQVLQEEKEQAIAVEDATFSRKRAAAQLPGAYSGMMDDLDADEKDDKDGPSSAKRSQQQTDDGGSQSPSGSAAAPKKGRAAGPKKTALQRSMELKGESQHRPRRGRRSYLY